MDVRCESVVPLQCGCLVDLRCEMVVFLCCKHFVEFMRILTLSEALYCCQLVAW